MKVDIEFVGYVKTLTAGDESAQVEMPGDSALMGEILVELAKQYDEKFTRLVVDEKNRTIHVVAMMDQKILSYETPMSDGAQVQLTVIMDGG